jgi:hypothetical protein
MSYRQLARMAPATLSVHLVLAIRSKTHFAKDMLNRSFFPRPTWQGLANNHQMLNQKFRFQIRSAMPRQIGKTAWRYVLVNLPDTE